MIDKNISKKSTIKDVARIAGVSTQTVSRVINNRPDVSAETRTRIQAIIAELGYQPSALARSLIHQRSYTLGVIIAGLKYIGISQTLAGIAGECESSGYSLLLKELSRFDLPDPQPVIQELLSHQVEGIIYAIPEIGDNWANLRRQLGSLSTPIIYLKGEAQPGYLTIAVNNLGGACLATSHLVEQGRRRIAHISGPLDWWEARQRQQGWRDALQQAGLPAAENQCIEGNWSSSSGDKAFRRLLESYPQMDAVFAANDQMALGILHVAHQQGLRVPDDLAVIGFDDLFEASYFTPALSTISQDLNLLGQLAVRKIVQMLSPEVLSPEPALADTITLQPSLVVRASTKQDQGLGLRIPG